MALLRRAGVALPTAALTVVGAIMMAPGGAMAACSPATGSNVTVTCSGTTFNQGPGSNTGYGDSTQNGLTVNVQSGASVTGTSIGIDVNNNNTINNLGTITTQGSGGVGDVYGINGNGPLTVNNSGSIGRADPFNKPLRHGRHKRFRRADTDQSGRRPHPGRIRHPGRRYRRDREFGADHRDRWRRRRYQLCRQP
jgi:hypothetical protein